MSESLRRFPSGEPAPADGPPAPSRRGRTGVAWFAGAALALLIGATAGAVEPPAQPERLVTGGLVRGRWLPDGAGAAFRGIPFAAPPVGPLRWKAPQPVVPWAGVRDAGEPGPPPAQENYQWNAQLAEAGREDCLYLDVWTPAAAATSRLPVMVWIHGGANTALAGGSEPIYEGHQLIQQGVVLVVIEYRLGIFGFLAHPELSRESPRRASGNYALLDQIAALAWVRDNIGQFGGDPANVTVFGQSAGAWNITALMSAPTARGLFHRAILQSGVPPVELSLPRSVAEARGEEIAQRLNAPATGAIEFLRRCPPADLLRAGPGLNQFCVEGVVLPEPPLEAWRGGRAHPVPVIIGGNAIEFPGTGTVDELRAALASTFGSLASRALALYGVDAGAAGHADPVYGSVQDRWSGDRHFRIPAILHGEWHQRAGQRVWQYEFGRALPPASRVLHSTELAYVFGNFREEGGMVTGRASALDREISGRLMRYWTNFARRGDPNGADVPAWPEFEPQQRQYLVVAADGSFAVQRNQRGEFTDLFRALLDPQAP